MPFSLAAEAEQHNLASGGENRVLGGGNIFDGLDGFHTGAAGARRSPFEQPGVARQRKNSNEAVGLMVGGGIEAGVKK